MSWYDAEAEALENRQAKKGEITATRKPLGGR